MGQGKYVVITAADGGIINDPVLLRLGENHFWLALADSDVLLWAGGLARRRRAAGRDSRARRLPAPDPGPQGEASGAGAVRRRDLTLPYYRFLETELDGIPVVVTRTGWTAEVGYEIYLRDGSRGDELWERIMAAGKPYDIRPTGPSDIRRIEAGILNWGADMTSRTTSTRWASSGWCDLDGAGDYMGRRRCGGSRPRACGAASSGWRSAGSRSRST